MIGLTMGFIIGFTIGFIIGFTIGSIVGFIVVNGRLTNHNGNVFGEYHGNGRSWDDQSDDIIHVLSHIPLFNQ